MYLRTDDDHNIIEVIFIGGMPEKNGFEVNELDIPKYILREDIYGYKYIDGEFIKKESWDVLQAHIEKIRYLKIEWLSSVCHELIEKGIDVDGSHYSLTGNDQLELFRLESIAKLSPLTPIFYHADGKKYRSYSAKEFLSIAAKAIAWITYHRTYFNLLKSEILEMDNAHDIRAINYGAPLNSSNHTLVKSILTDYVTPEVVVDDFDYESLFVKPAVSIPEGLVGMTMGNEEVLSKLEKMGGET